VIILFFQAIVNGGFFGPDFARLCQNLIGSMINTFIKKSGFLFILIFIFR
jgi:hypothetical protein